MLLLCVYYMSNPYPDVYSFAKELEAAKVRSRISHRAESLRRGLNGDPAQRYLGYIPEARRYNQAVPPDPPASPSAAALTPPTSTPPPDSFEDVYSTIPDSALSAIDLTQSPEDPPDDSLAQEAFHSKHLDQWDGPSGIEDIVRRLQRSIGDGCATPLTVRDGCATQFTVRTPSRSPTTQTPSFPETPPPDMRSALHDLRAFLLPYSQPCTYPDDVTATPRDIAIDYEGVMIAVQDLNRLTKYICGRGGWGTRQPDPTGSETTRADVIEMLAMLKTGIDRLFARLEMID